MPLFRISAGLPDHEKARIEYHLQQLSECLGFRRFQIPILIPENSFGHDAHQISVQKALEIVGQHLSYDVKGIEVRTLPQPLPISGGGG